jgi:hypothetical protein
MTREAQVRLRKGLGVKFAGATQPGHGSRAIREGAPFPSVRPLSDLSYCILADECCIHRTNPAMSRNGCCQLAVREKVHPHLSDRITI